MDTENLRPMIPTRKGRYRLYKGMACEDGLQLCGSNAWLVSGHWKRHSGSAFADDELRVADTTTAEVSQRRRAATRYAACSQAAIACG